MILEGNFDADWQKMINVCHPVARVGTLLIEVASGTFSNT